MLFLFFFQAVVMVIESMHEKTDEAMCKLLQALFRSFVITFDQMKNVSVTISILTYIDVCSGSWLRFWHKVLAAPSIVKSEKQP